MFLLYYKTITDYRVVIKHRDLSTSIVLVAPQPAQAGPVSSSGRSSDPSTGPASPLQSAPLVLVI